MCKTRKKMNKTVKSFQLITKDRRTRILLDTPSPTFNPAAVRLAIFLADADTKAVAPAIDRRKAVMSAPRVTVSALMRLGWSQLTLWH
jgi:hypothetical protein